MKHANNKASCTAATVSSVRSRIGRRIVFVVAIGLLAGNVEGQVIRYVTPEGANAKDGTTWENAYSTNELQTAISDTRLTAGSIIYLKEGFYPRTTQLGITNAVGLTISGGWVGNDVGGLPGERSANLSILRRASGTTRIVYATGSTLVFEYVAIYNGYLTSNNDGGAGMRLNSSTTTIRNSSIAANRGGTGATMYGYGIFAFGGTLILSDSEVVNNGDGGNNMIDYGGAFAPATTSHLRRPMWYSPTMPFSPTIQV